MAKILVVGSLNVDLVARAARLPAEGETIHGSSFQTFAGGKGANQAVCAARLGGEVAMIGRLGDDVFAAQLRGALETDGVDLEGVRTVAGASGTALITVSDAGANTIIVVPGANEALQPEALDEHRGALQGAAIVLAQLETPLPTVLRLAERAEAERVPLLLDPAPAQALPPALLQRVTWLTPNESEACTLLQGLGHAWGDHLPDEAVAQAAAELLRCGVRNVILKLGERGVYLAGQDVPPTRLHAHRVPVVDTTAAGDAFNGGFAYALTQGRMAPVEAAAFACAVAAVSVTRAGAQGAMPRLTEVHALMAGRG